MKRVAIIGSGGAGKSTLARQVGDATGFPVIHLDREHWQPGWVAPGSEAWAARVAELVAGEAWIIDGNYGGTMEARFARADTIVLLDLPRTVCLYRAVKRAVLFRNRGRPDMRGEVRPAVPEVDLGVPGNAQARHPRPPQGGARCREARRPPAQHKAGANVPAHACRQHG